MNMILNRDPNKQETSQLMHAPSVYEYIVMDQDPTPERNMIITHIYTFHQDPIIEAFELTSLFLPKLLNQIGK